MAYESQNLNLKTPRLGAGAGGANAGNASAEWTYVSADAVAAVIAAGYISDGDDQGIQVNDHVVVIDTSGPTIDLCLVTAVAADGGVTMINGT